MLGTTTSLGSGSKRTSISWGTIIPLTTPFIRDHLKITIPMNMAVSQAQLLGSCLWCSMVLHTQMEAFLDLDAILTTSLPSHSADINHKTSATYRNQTLFTPESLVQVDTLLLLIWSGLTSVVPSQPVSGGASGSLAGKPSSSVTWGPSCRATWSLWWGLESERAEVGKVPWAALYQFYPVILATSQDYSVFREWHVRPCVLIGELYKARMGIGTIL